MASSPHPPLAKLKALPPVTKAHDLPPPPPSPLQAPSSSIPMPPPKNALPSQPNSPSASSVEDGQLSERSPGRVTLAPPDTSFPSESSSGLDLPSPGAPSANDSRPKKVNPFVDLLETEKVYVDTLSGIIRKVAAAWSRSNLPPVELDMIFRSVEAIYKANRSFQAKLKEIGPNPSSPRAIGDLLMKWIDQLDSPYSKYASAYLSGFDAWEPVRNNQRLPSILETFSASNPQPQTTIWSLDALLSLPRLRIKYYQKLYSRLLKNSGPGKATDQKLIEGVEKLEKLLLAIEERSQISLPGPVQILETSDEVVIDTRRNAEHSKNSDSQNDEDTSRGRSDDTLRLCEEPDVRTSVESSFRGSDLSSGLRSSRDTSMTSEGRASVATLSMSLADLEQRLCTERCQDLFTMTPRNVKLSINSVNLPYTREIRLSEDASIHFTPKSISTEVTHARGHIFVLTDLFLVCERMTFEERARFESGGTDMWLCYPPLAAKHLRVAPLEATGIEATILKKEIMCLYFDTPAKRDTVLKEFKATAELAVTLPPPSKQAPPPVPSTSNSSTSGAVSSVRQPNNPSNGTFSPSRSATSSPISGASMHRVDPGRNSSSDSSRFSAVREGGPPPYSPSNDPGRAPMQMASPAPRPPDPSLTSEAFGQFVPPSRSESSCAVGMPPLGTGNTGLSSRPSVRDGPSSGPPSISPGQVFPPRADSVRSRPPNGTTFLPRGPMSPPPINIMHGPPRNMMSPPPMNGMNNGPPQVGFSPGLFGNGPMNAPHLRIGGPGPGAVFTGSDSMRGPQSSGPIPNHPHQLPHPGQPFANLGRPSSDPNYQGGLRKTPSLHSVLSQSEQYQRAPRSAPPVPSVPNGFIPVRQNSFGNPGPGQNHLHPTLPSAALPRIASSTPAFGLDDSPPGSPTDRAPKKPVESVILASMKCKIFLQQQHAQWKSLGSSKLTLYEQRPTMLKQLVVEADNKDKAILISTIVLTDGVERVGKTGVAVELSDNGARTGIVYMIQLRNEKSAGGLYDSLLSGSDRGGFRG